MRNKANILIASCAVVALCGLGFSVVKKSQIPAKAAVKQTDQIVKATNLFLKTLSDDQRKTLLFPFTAQKSAIAAKFARNKNQNATPSKNGTDMPKPDPSSVPPGQKGTARNEGSPGGNMGGEQFPGFIGEQYGKAVWSNYPVSDVPRPGIQLGSLNTAQRAAAMNMLKQLLSEQGFQKVQDIMGSDQALADAGQNFASGKDTYTLAIFGTPNSATPWMVEFGGHHLGLNLIIAGPFGTLTPTLTGAQPSVYQSNGKTVRVLAEENDRAFELMGSLDEVQRKKAILNYKIGDLVLGPGHDGEVIVPEGLKGSSLNSKQKEMLTGIIAQWAGIISKPYLERRMKEIQAGIEETYFAWSGPLTHQPGKNGTSYYRIQGPRVIIEFSPQGVGGDPAMHVHTIYRDPGNEYGQAYLKK